MAKALPARHTIDEAALTSGRRMQADEAVQQAHPAAAGPDSAGRLVLAPARLDGLDGAEADAGTLGLPAEVPSPESAVVQLQRRDRVFPFWRYFWNTTVITFLTVLGSAISNPIVAYGFSRIEWPGRDKLFGLVLATVFIPFPVLIVGLFDIYNTLAGSTRTCR